MNVSKQDEGESEEARQSCHEPCSYPQHDQVVVELSREHLVVECKVVSLRLAFDEEAVAVEDDKDENTETLRESCEEKQHEHVVVLVADASVHPGAVVVEPLHALVAHTTVARSRSADNLTLRAELDWVD